MNSDTTTCDGKEHAGEVSQARIAVASVDRLGLISDTRIVTEQGLRPVRQLAAGDEVLTFDNGLRPLSAVDRRVIWRDPEHVPQSHWPVIVPSGALENGADILLLPQQAVMLEWDAQEEDGDDPFALLEARALDGFRRISRIRPVAPVEIVSLCFAQDEVVYVEDGCLVLCPQPFRTVEAMLDPRARTYDLLPGHQAKRLLELLTKADEHARRQPVGLTQVS